MEQFSDDDIDAGVDKVKISMNTIQLNKKKYFYLQVIFYLVQQPILEHKVNFKAIELEWIWFGSSDTFDSLMGNFIWAQSLSKRAITKQITIQ